MGPRKHKRRARRCWHLFGGTLQRRGEPQAASEGVLDDNGRLEADGKTDEADGPQEHFVAKINTFLILLAEIRQPPQIASRAPLKAEGMLLPGGARRARDQNAHTSPRKTAQAARVLMIPRSHLVAVGPMTSSSGERLTSKLWLRMLRAATAEASRQVPTKASTKMPLWRRPPRGSL